MKIEGKVIKAVDEVRDFVNKQGVKESKRIVKIVMMSNDGEVINAKSYDDTLKELPKQGSVFTIESIKKYENYQGMVAEVLF